MMRKLASQKSRADGAMNAYGLAEGYILTMEEKEELEIDGKQVHVLPTWEWMLREK